MNSSVVFLKLTHMVPGTIYKNLTSLDRRRLTGARVRNNGFIGILTKTRRKKSIAQRHKGTEAARCLKAARNPLS